MQVGIDSFATWDNADLSISPSERLQRLVEQIEYVLTFNIKASNMASNSYATHLIFYMKHKRKVRELHVFL